MEKLWSYMILYFLENKLMCLYLKPASSYAPIFQYDLDLDLDLENDLFYLWIVFTVFTY